MSREVVQAGGATYELDAQPVRTSLSDSPHMLWGFEVNVLQDGAVVGVKTCFVGRVSVMGKDPEALQGPIEGLIPVLHELALAKVRARVEEGETDDEIVFA